MPARTATACLASLLVAACGGQAAGRPACTPGPPLVPRTTQGQLTASADAGAVAPGATEGFTLVAQGPVTFTASCDGPVQLLVSDETTLRVYSAAAATGPSSPCGAVTLGSGQRAVYSVAWPVDPTLPPGSYVAQLVLGDQPTLQLTLRVGTQPPGC